MGGTKGHPKYGGRVARELPPKEELLEQIKNGTALYKVARGLHVNPQRLKAYLFGEAPKRGFTSKARVLDRDEILRDAEEGMSIRKLAMKYHIAKTTVVKVLGPGVDRISNRMSQIRRSTNESICWLCENAVPCAEEGRGCSWSVRGLPMLGWDAERMDIKIYETDGSFKTVESYRVRKCPKFKEG